MNRVRRVKPSTLAGRKRQAELGQIISSPRTSKEDRAAALEELNLLAPIVGSSPEDGSPIENEDSFPTVSNPNPVRSGDQSLSAWLKRIFAPEVQLELHALNKSIAVDKAKNASDTERAAYLLKSLPEHPLVKMATELVNNLRFDSKSPQTLPLETEVAWWVNQWLGPYCPSYNASPLPPKTRSDVLAAVANAYRLLAVKDRDEPGWYVRLAEQRYAVPPPIFTPGETK